MTEFIVHLEETLHKPYVVWNNGELEQFCYTRNDAYFVLQEVLDELRTGLDWDEPEDDDDEEDF